MEDSVVERILLLEKKLQKNKTMETAKACLTVLVAEKTGPIPKKRSTAKDSIDADPNFTFLIAPQKRDTVKR